LFDQKRIIIFEHVRKRLLSQANNNVNNAYLLRTSEEVVFSKRKTLTASFEISHRVRSLWNFLGEIE